MKHILFLILIPFICSCASGEEKAKVAAAKAAELDVAPLPEIKIQSYFEDTTKKPNTIRSAFNRDYQKLRRENNRSAAKERKDFSRAEKKARKEFLKLQKEKRSEFKKEKHPKEESKAFFAEVDSQRKDYFADEKDKRKDYDSERKQKKKDFDSLMKDKKKEFDEYYKAYNKSYRDAKKLQKSGFKKFGGSVVNKQEENPKLTEEQKNFIKDFNKVPPGEGEPLKAGAE